MILFQDIVASESTVGFFTRTWMRRIRKFLMNCQRIAPSAWKRSWISLLCWTRAIMCSATLVSSRGMSTNQLRPIKQHVVVEIIHSLSVMSAKNIAFIYAWFRSDLQSCVWTGGSISRVLSRRRQARIHEQEHGDIFFESGNLFFAYFVEEAYFDIICVMCSLPFLLLLPNIPRIIIIIHDFEHYLYTITIGSACSIYLLNILFPIMLFSRFI